MNIIFVGILDIRSNQTFILFTYGEMERNIDYKKEFDLACEKLAKQEKKIEKLKIELWWVQWERDGLKMVVERLHKEIEEQDKEYCKLKEELSKYKDDIIYEEWLYD